MITSNSHGKDTINSNYIIFIGKITKNDYHVGMDSGFRVKRGQSIS